MDIYMLNKRRKDLNLSIDDLAKKSNLPKSTVEKVLFGVVKHPRIDTIQAIERALGISEQSYEEQAKMTVSPSEAEILALWRELSDDGQATTKAMMILLAQQKK